MIHDDPATSDAYRRSDFDQLRRFLASRGVPETVYRIAPASRPAEGEADAGAILVATYSQERFRNGNMIGWLTWPTPSGPANVRTSLSETEFMIAFAFDRGENLALLTEISADTDAATAADMLGLERSVLRRHVSAYYPGTYIAPDAGGWAYFLVEPYGEVVVLADGPQAAPMLQMLASHRLQQEQNLAGRMAEFMVPIAPEDVAE